MPLRLRVRWRVYKFPFNKILYVETSPAIHKVILHTQEERFEFYASIADIEKADPRLYRCHRPFVVNPQNITKIDKEAKKAFWKWRQLLDLTDQV